MKIAFFIRNLSAGGAERVLSQLTQALANSGHDISVFCFPSNRTEQFYTLSQKVTLYTIPSKICDDTLKIIEELNPDILVSFLLPAHMLVCDIAKICKIPYVVCERNDPYYSPQNSDEREIRDKIFRNADGCVFQTKNAADYFSDITGRIVIIENPVSIQCRPSAWNDRDKKIVSVGRYVPQKNFELLLQSFALFYHENEEYALEIYGKEYGETLQLLKNSAKRLQIDHAVTFHSEQVDIHTKIKRASVFISSSDFEGYPNALAEAAALGIPCVATDIPGSRAIIGKYNCGILVPKNSRMHMLQAITDIVSNDEVQKKFSSNGQRILTDHRIETISEQWESFFYNIIQMR